MKIGIISDIHSNIYAFEACVARLEQEGCDEYFFLGDYISDAPYPERTLDYLYDFCRNHKCYLLKGNREEYMLSQKRVKDYGEDGVQWIPNSASGNLLYTYERLRKQDWDFIEALPITFVYHKDGYPDITCCHGSPNNSRELLELDEDKVLGWLDEIDTNYMICAHTHRPGKLKYKNKWYFNSGCSGLAISDPGLAQCMIIHDEEVDGEVCWVPEFIKVPYDTATIIKEMFTSGLYDMGHWFINTNIKILLTGIDQAAELIHLSQELAEKDTGDAVIWPFIDERYFEQAANILEVPDYGCKASASDI